MSEADGEAVTLESTPARRFHMLWQRCGDSSDAGPLFGMIEARYGETGRFYHQLDHVLHCLDEFDRLPGYAADRNALELAIWFHDVVYVPGAVDNEARSAALFAAHAGALPSSLTDRVVRLIMATTHRQPPADDLEAAMVDIDLSGFGIGWEDFVRDSRNVRAELVHRSDSQYYPSQTRFLSSLLARPRLYFTEHFHTRYEQGARGNIQRLLEHIARHGCL